MHVHYTTANVVTPKCVSQPNPISKDSPCVLVRPGWLAGRPRWAEHAVTFSRTWDDRREWTFGVVDLASPHLTWITNCPLTDVGQGQRRLQDKKGQGKLDTHMMHMWAATIRPVSTPCAGRLARRGNWCIATERKKKRKRASPTNKDWKSKMQLNNSSCYRVFSSSGLVFGECQGSIELDGEETRPQ